MRLLANYLQKETGRRSTKGPDGNHRPPRRLDGELRAAIEGPKRYCQRNAVTAANRRRLLRPRRHSSRRASRRESLAGVAGGRVGSPVDLLIRTGGERRLSDFLLWECAYAS